MMKKAILSFLLSVALISPGFADSLGSAVGGTAGNQSNMAGGIYLSSPAVLTNGQQGGFAIDPITHAILTAPASASNQTVNIDQTTAGTTNGVVVKPAAVAGAGVAPVQSAAVETGHVIKASAGNLYNFNVSADATLSAVAWAVLIFNSTTVPAAGAVTPVKCYLAPIGITSVSGDFSMPLYLGTGISIAVSTGQTCFTKTDSAHGFISANAQ